MTLLVGRMETVVEHEEKILEFFLDHSKEPSGTGIMLQNPRHPIAMHPYSENVAGSFEFNV